MTLAPGSYVTIAPVRTTKDVVLQLERFTSVETVGPPNPGQVHQITCSELDSKACFFLTGEVYMVDLKVNANGIYVKCSRCNKRKLTEGATCSNCQSTGEDLEVVTTGVLLDGFGKRIHARIPKEALLQMLALDEDDLYGLLDEDKTLAILARFCNNETRYRVFISTNSGAWPEVEQLYEHITAPPAQ